MKCNKNANKKKKIALKHQMPTPQTSHYITKLAQFKNIFDNNKTNLKTKQNK